MALGAKAVQVLGVKPVIPAVLRADGRLVVHLARDVAAARVGRVAVVLAAETALAQHCGRERTPFLGAVEGRVLGVVVLLLAPRVLLGIVALSRGLASLERLLAFWAARRAVRHEPAAPRARVRQHRPESMGLRSLRKHSSIPRHSWWRLRLFFFRGPKGHCLTPKARLKAAAT